MRGKPSSDSLSTLSVDLDAADAAHRLGRWFARQHRDLPWRRSRDPYAIWISEIMLQQTRVDTVIPYYERFLERFPTVEALARAPVDEVLKRWEGLGYYARARNLHRAARIVAESGMPRGRDALLALPGVGRYTAGAISSIAYGEAVAAVDGNVERVLSRLLAAPRLDPWPLAEALVRGSSDPSAHNQALMELGATVCTPRAPQCDVCPLGMLCAARRLGDPTRFPEKERVKALPQRDVVAALVWSGERFLVVRRPSEGLLGGLWDLPWAERESREALEQTCARALQTWTDREGRIIRKMGVVTHVFTHFRMRLHAFECTCDEKASASAISQWIEPRERDALAFPRATHHVFALAFDGSPRRTKGRRAHSTL